MTPETRIRNEICSWLRWQRVLCFVHDSIGIWNEKRGVYMRNLNPYRMKGVADVLGIYKGTPLAIEVKSKTGRLTPDQKVFLAEWEKHGGIAIVARSIDDVQKGLAKFQEQKDAKHTD